MTNYEYYKDEIERLVRLGIRPTFTLDGKIAPCECLPCSECIFDGCGITPEGCTESFIRWADEQYNTAEDYMFCPLCGQRWKE